MRISGGRFVGRVVLAAQIGVLAAVGVLPGCPWGSLGMRALIHLTGALRSVGFEGASESGGICWFTSILVLYFVGSALAILFSAFEEHLAPAKRLENMPKIDRRKTPKTPRVGTLGFRSNAFS